MNFQSKTEIKIWKNFKKIAFMLSAISVLSACGGGKTLEYKERSVDKIYSEAVRYLNLQNYKYAAIAFDEVERQHPYSSWARRAQLMSAYSYYMANKYQDSIMAAQRFIALHPGNKDAAYAYYLVAICYYELITDVRRDQKTTMEALEALIEVVRRFPHTDYARDARMKIDLARDHLAGKEMNTGRFYQHNEDYFAAINRYNVVVKKYGTTSHVPEALHRLVEAYLAVGILPEAMQIASVLKHNYPKSRWNGYTRELMDKLLK